MQATVNAAPMPGCVDDLWPRLLAIARVQHGGAEPAAPSTPACGLARGAATGWQLQGPWDGAAQALFAVVKPLLDVPADGRSWVMAQLGQSLDGCVATRSGDSCFINGPEILTHLHRLRALNDAVIVGAGTVAFDNPRLTTRHVSGPNPTRVLLDPTLRLAGLVSDAHVFTDGQAATLWLCDEVLRGQAEALVGAQRVLAVPELLGEGGVLQLERAVAALNARGLVRLFVEGGGVTVSRFLVRGCLDRLHLAVAPLLIGDGRPGLRFAGAERLADCARPHCSVHRMGRDQLWDLDLRTPG